MSTESSTQGKEMISKPLQGEHIELRALEPEDLDLLYKWENDTTIWKVSDRLLPLSKYHLKRFLDNYHKDLYETKQMRLMIQLKEESRPIGAIDLFDFDPYHKRAAIGILISAPEDRRKGYAAEALDLFISYGFGTLGLHLMYCSITSNNTASLNLFNQAGFKITGTKSEWTWDGERFLDEHFLQIVR